MYKLFFPPPLVRCCNIVSRARADPICTKYNSELNCRANEAALVMLLISDKAGLHLDHESKFCGRSFC